MSRSRIRPRSLVAVAAGAVTVGIVAGAAEGGDRPRAPLPSRPAPRVPPAAPTLARPLPCRPRRAAERKAPSETLLRTFGVLRRERTDRDALPPTALAALRRQGLEPVDPASARLLREGPGGAAAWIVPVPDVNLGFFGSPFGCRPAAVPRRARPPRARLPRGRAVPPAPALAAPLWAARPPIASGPQEGVAVVSVGGVPGGGGGSLRDLVRGRAPVAVDPCFGVRRNMVGISGLVPDGVEAAFLTAGDGSAVRADVTDNAFAFVVPRDRRPQQRYVVWSGADGTPHVQPVFVPFQRGGRFCPRIPERIARLPRVSPGVFNQFGPGGTGVSGLVAPAPMFVPARPAPRPLPIPSQTPPPAPAAVPAPAPPRPR